MTYDLREHRKNPDYLTPEEFEVQAALKEAGYKWDENELRSFIPTRVLYQVYRRHIAGKTYRHLDGVEDLTLSQFGAALGRIYPGLNERGDTRDSRGRPRSMRRVKRRWRGVSAWGYVGFTGPDCEMSRDERGRPRIEDED